MGEPSAPVRLAGTPFHGISGKRPFHGERLYQGPVGCLRHSDISPGWEAQGEA